MEEQFVKARLRRSLRQLRKDVAHVYDSMPPGEKVQNALWFAEKMARETLEKLVRSPDHATDEEIESIRAELEAMVFKLVGEEFGVKLPSPLRSPRDPHGTTASPASESK